MKHYLDGEISGAETYFGAYVHKSISSMRSNLSGTNKRWELLNPHLAQIRQVGPKSTQGGNKSHLQLEPFRSDLMNKIVFMHMCTKKKFVHLIFPLL
uniref:Uncharacterized protein n=1 Tax=Arundo donax TaxID=35708 RepID=A0A0A9B0P6_ARUDO